MRSRTHAFYAGEKWQVFLSEQQTAETALYQSTIANWHYLSSFHQSVIHVDEEVSTSTVCWLMLLLMMISLDWSLQRLEHCRRHN